MRKPSVMAAHQAEVNVGLVCLLTPSLPLHPDVPSFERVRERLLLLGSDHDGTRDLLLHCRGARQERADEVEYGETGV